MRFKFLLTTALSLAPFFAPTGQTAHAQAFLRRPNGPGSQQRFIPGAGSSLGNGEMSRAAYYNGRVSYTVLAQGRFGTASWQTGFGGIWYGANFPAATAAAYGYHSFSGGYILVNGQWVYGTVYWIPSKGYVSFTDVYQYQR